MCGLVRYLGRTSATTKLGLRFGQLGYELVEKGGLQRFQARTYMWYGQFVMPWTKHLRAEKNVPDLPRDLFAETQKSMLSSTPAITIRVSATFGLTELKGG